jgi:acetyltransferase-like isoleucine patch superfamily enzyme
MLEESIRMIPGLYSLWLRLWGGRIGSLVYWSPGVVILDRSLVRIGSRVIFGVGARLVPHVLAPNGARRMALYLSPITVGDGALIGGYSVLLPGCQVGDEEVTPPFRTIHAFTRFANGRRIRIAAEEHVG